MNKENKQMALIYMLVFIIIILIVTLTKIVIDSTPKKIKNNSGYIDKLEINPYPNVNDECTFNISYNEYNNLTIAGCQGGYTRYNINDILLSEKQLKVSVIYSDKKQVKVGLFINDKKMTTVLEDITKIKFGIFDNKLFVLDTNNKETNTLAYNKEGKEVYNLKQILESNKIKDLSTGDTIISSKTLDQNSFSFNEGYIEFNSISNNCQNSEASKGSHYKITYKNNKFELPEFMNLVDCS